MTLATEAELVQNAALGAVVLSAFTVEFYDQRRRQAGPPLPYLLPVLPMVMHEETVTSIYRRHFDGGLLLAIAEDRTLTLELQERMETMMPQTMQALNVAFSSKLLTYRGDTGQVWAESRHLPNLPRGEESKPLIAAATRLGYWFSTISIDQLCAYLRIRF
ncbi:MAG TPA: three component ABC system middle component [Candidatus Didemnitutus sp.]|nr:three component ABC system middle component [Candidatus Didemnitutus sp.]